MKAQLKLKSTAQAQRPNYQGRALPTELMARHAVGVHLVDTCFSYSVWAQRCRVSGTKSTGHWERKGTLSILLKIRKCHGSSNGWNESHEEDRSKRGDQRKCCQKLILQNRFSEMEVSICSNKGQHMQGFWRGTWGCKFASPEGERDGYLNRRGGIIAFCVCVFMCVACCVLHVA